MAPRRHGGMSSIQTSASSDDFPASRNSNVWRAVVQLSQNVDLDSMALPKEDLRRLDEEADGDFYANPCFSQHVDDGFLSRLTDLYRKLLKPNSRVLDLCSSFDSHLPPQEEIPLRRVTGHGMNDAELAANTRLDSFFLLDLNTPREGSSQAAKFPMGKGQVDMVLCCCGIQYLTRPLEVLRECLRVLAPGGTIVLSFSSHCWPEKALAGWLSRDMVQRQELVEQLLLASGFMEVETFRSIGAGHGSDEEARSISDPFVAVVARHPAVPASAAAVDAEEQGHFMSGANSVLMEASLLAGDGNTNVSDASDNKQRAAAMARWVSAYEAMKKEATSMGIPASAVPVLPTEPQLEDIRKARELLSGIIASYLSANI